MDPSIINKRDNWVAGVSKFEEKECIQGELYQIGRTVINLIQHCIDQFNKSNKFADSKGDKDYHKNFFL